jgi:hypothetical protein
MLNAHGKFAHFGALLWFWDKMSFSAVYKELISEKGRQCRF